MEADETATVTTSTHDKKRTSSVFGSLFRSNTALAPERQVDCLTCGSDDVPESKSAKLACGHRMCHDCLKRIFRLSVTDPQHMPPKCCTDDHIPLKHVDRLFRDKFKVLWNRKYQEYTTKNRLYCPAKGCAEWIKPSHIHMDASAGRKYGKCSRCKTKVCALCNGKWHNRKECPKDEELNKFVEMAKKSGWQKCYNCKAMVELKEGCNHMTCRCTAEFCMICGLQWKTCDCPWFNYAAVEADRLDHMNVPEPIRILYRRVRAPNRADGPQAQAPGYGEEMRQRRDQERTDAEMARHMAAFGTDDDDDDDRRQPAYGFGNVFGFGNAAAARYVNEEFVQNATNILTAALGQARLAVRQQAQQRQGDADGAAPSVRELNRARRPEHHPPLRTDVHPRVPRRATETLQTRRDNMERGLDGGSLQERVVACGTAILRDAVADESMARTGAWLQQVAHDMAEARQQRVVVG